MVTVVRGGWSRLLPLPYAGEAAFHLTGFRVPALGAKRLGEPA